ncbi:hypothetical protein NY78_2272 [Desulfovibrio sp. TomC]|nr:hypothetical protein NY78_2272 [Desulfovibrio sp. TomC]
MRVAGFVLVLGFWIVLSLTCPRGAAAADDFDSMMPDQLSKELRKAETAYHKVMEEVRAAENERLARKAAGAADAALKEADDELARLLRKAEKLKVEADYLDELYEVKRREYKNK